VPADGVTDATDASDVPAPTPRRLAAAWLSRFEQFDVVGSTNDVVLGWLREGTPEVCLAIADVQSAGRGRNGRKWSAPPGAAVLASVGFTPTWLEVGHTWRLGAVVSLAMAEACEVASGMRPGSISLKWPNDLVVIDRSHGDVRKLAGMLGETEGLGTADARAVFGIGANVEWPRERFPAEMARSMTSVADLAPAKHLVERDLVIDVFLQRLERFVTALKAGSFPAEEWTRRQLTNGTIVILSQPDGTSETVVAERVDPETGALVVRDTQEGSPPRPVIVGEIEHMRIGGVM
jgi:BirA family transcriptional regulator, biotin operon repressor / biotin---[acetyl-CoA-carboxylase] ligase